MKRAAFLLPLAWLVACGGEAPPEEPEARDGAFDDLTGTLERAGAVEDTVLEQKDRLDRAIDDAAGGAEDEDDEPRD